eukprot:g629.t1
MGAFLSSLRRRNVLPYVSLLVAALWIYNRRRQFRRLALERIVSVPSASSSHNNNPFEPLIHWAKGNMGGGQFESINMLITHKGKTVFRCILGEHSDLGQTPPIFRIFSMTKSIVAVTALIFVDRGLLSLDEPIAKWLPEYKDMKVYDDNKSDNYSKVDDNDDKSSNTSNQDEMKTVPCQTPITLRHLLTHTSGLSYGFSLEHPVDKLYKSKAGIKTITGMFYDQTWHRKIADLPLCFQPGSKFLYSAAYDVLGTLLCKVYNAKKSPSLPTTSTQEEENRRCFDLEDILQKEIFTPLGMKDTSFYVPTSETHRVVTMKKLARETGFKLTECLPKTLQRGLYGQKPPFLSGGGGLFSTIDDYSRFTLALLQNRLGEASSNKQLLSPELHAMATQVNQLPNGTDLPSYHATSAGRENKRLEGQGHNLIGSMVIDSKRCLSRSSCNGDYGWSGIAGTHYVISPSRESTLVFMTQSFPSYSLPAREQFTYLASKCLKKL